MSVKRKILVKPELKHTYPNGGFSEKVTYLDIPMDAYLYSLQEDLNHGGVQFKEVKKLLEKQKLSKVIAISADSKEMGLMAVSYLAIEVNGRLEEYPCDVDEVFVEGRWNDTANHIPVIYDYELLSYLKEDQSYMESGGFLMGQAQKKGNQRPYWCDCKMESICLILSRDTVEEVCLEAIHMFQQNRQVYVIFLNEKDSKWMEVPFGVMDLDHFNALKNNFILSFAAEEALVSFGDHDSSTYYNHVLKKNLEQRSIRPKRGLSYERVVNLARSIQKSSVCEMLDKIINYAIKDKECNQEIALGNKDFSFIDHFTREEVYNKEKKNTRKLLEDNLVGIEDIKQQVYDVVNVMKYNKIRSELKIGNSQFHNVHVMLGAPGTAKTTVAQYMGKMMFEEKLLPDDRMICINGAELKGMYVGHSAPKTKALFENYDVIIIDEAYSIVESSGATDSFGNEAIAQLIIELERHSTDKLVIFAGYGGEDLEEKDNKMQAFLDANPGIKSRITSTFYFKSYTVEDMVDIFERIAKNSNYELQIGSRKLVKEFFKTRVKVRDFGNGREARMLLETSVLFAARRTMLTGKTSFSEKEMKFLSYEDMNAAIKKMSEGFGNRRKVERKIGFAS